MGDFSALTFMFSIPMRGNEMVSVPTTRAAGPRVHHDPDDVRSVHAYVQAVASGSAPQQVIVSRRSLPFRRRVDGSPLMRTCPTGRSNLGWSFMSTAFNSFAIAITMLCVDRV